MIRFYKCPHCSRGRHGTVSGTIYQCADFGYQILCGLCENGVDLRFVVRIFIVSLERIRIDGPCSLLADRINSGLVNAPYVPYKRLEIDEKYFMLDVVF